MISCYVWEASCCWKSQLANDGVWEFGVGTTVHAFRKAWYTFGLMNQRMALLSLFLRSAMGILSHYHETQSCHIG